MNGPSDGQLEEITPFPSIEDDNDSREPEIDPKEKGKDKDVTPKKKPPGHKRSISGNLLKLLRSGSAERVDQDGTAAETSRSAMAGAMSDTHKRKRKGSLRKTVLGKGREKDKDRKGKSPLASPSTATSTSIDISDSTALATPRPSAEFSPEESPTSPEPIPVVNPPRWPFRTLSKVSIPSIRSSVASVEPASSTASMRNPNDVGGLSTDEDDEVLPKDAASDNDDDVNDFPKIKRAKTEE